MGWTVVEVVATPNPNAMKYVLDRAISATAISFFTPAAGREHPLAGPLFAIDGVAGVLILNDFVTVSRVPTANWKPITAAVKKTLAVL